MTVIIANGRFPTHPTPLSYIERASFIVCCDGAANEFIEIGGKPNAIVGDCDSISKENIVRFADILYPNNDQETNDLTKSVQFCVDKGIKDITIVGGTGKREDHTLGNISLLAEYVHIANVIMATNWGVFTPINTTTQFKSFIGEQVSIFSIDHTRVSSQNLKYPLSNRILSNWWEGSLNESLDESFTIQTAGRIIVFQAYII
jgi:thiamine pyrophosphokinase